MTEKPDHQTPTANPPAENLPAPGAIPVDAAPRTPTTVSYATSWFYFLMGCSLCVAWYLPIKIFLTWWFLPPLRENPRTAYEFVALSYEGVSGKLNEVSPKRFREHLQAMTQAGYVPITLEEVLDLVKKGKPVPAKSVLLTFDHGRKSSYFSVKSMLRKSGWHAVMFVWTKPIAERDPAVLLWPYVGALVKSKNWEVGAQSHNGFAKMSISPVGEIGHFLTNPRWLSAEGRFETREEMQVRVSDDFDTCFRMIEKESGERPIAFAFPYGDFGQYQRAAEFPRRLNLGLVSKLCELAFVSGNFGLNTKDSDPYRLNRLRVNANWDGSELISQIERLWSKPDQVGKPAYAAQPSAWAVDEGRLTADAGKLILSATEATTGCRAWLTGSDSFTDLDASLAFIPERGNTAISFRATPDMERYVYLAFDRTGDVWLRQKDPQHAPVTLAYSNLGVIPLQKPHRLEVTMRGRSFYALLDGKPVFDKHIELKGTPGPGMFGISAWNTEKNAARVTLYSLDLHAPEPILVSWAPEQNGDPYSMGWLHENAHRFAFVSPPWTPGAGGETGEAGEKGTELGLFQVVSRIHHMGLVPRLDIARRMDLSKWTPVALADALRPYQCAGLFVDISPLDSKDLSAALQWLRQSDVELKRRSLGLLVRLPAALRNLPEFKTFVSSLPGVKLVAAAGDPPLDNQPPPVRKEEIPPAKPGTPVPFTYELPEATKKPGDMQVEDQEKLLLEQGQSAYAHGDYKNAIGFWSRLQKMDPSSPEPTMLIGDAYLQLGDLDSALVYYRRSLDLDPSRISFVVRMARILDQKEKSEDARQLLNTYARIFPGNSDIMMAQVAWLERHEQYDEAKQLALRVLSADNANLQAMGFMLRLATSREEKLEVLRRLFALEYVPDLYARLAETFWRSDLLNLPESHTLGDLIRRLAQRLPAESDKNPYLRLLPVVDGVTENLREHGLSDAWLADGGQVVTAPGRITLSTDPTRTEATIRLLGSDRFRNSFIEADVSDVVGQFYLYARRGLTHYVRFGFDTLTGDFNLQVYRNGKAVSTMKSSGRLPSRSSEVIRLRLDLLGDGAMGLVNGEPLFANPISIPRDGDLGWYGAGIFSKDQGQARATLEYLAGGPNPVRMALFPEGIGGDDLDVSLASLRQTLGLSTHLCPIWFSIGPYGNWLNLQNTDSDVVRLFARYYRLRLWPAVRVKRDTMVMPADVLRMARDQSVDGFVLLLDEMPTDKWFDLMTQELRLSAVEVVAVVANRATGKSDIRPVGAARDWFPLNIGEKPADTISVPQGEDGAYVLPDRLPARDPLILLYAFERLIPIAPTVNPPPLRANRQP